MSLNKDLILRRLSNFYKYSKENSALAKVNGFILLKGKEDDPYSKTQSMQVWFTGHELPDTCLLLCKNGIHFLASRKKAELMKIIESDKENADLPPIKIHSRDPSDNDKGNISVLMDAIKSAGSDNNIGMLSKCKPEGSFADNILKAIDSHGINRVDVTESIAQMLGVKDDEEIELMQKSAEVCCTLLTKFVRAKAIEAIESDRKIKHSEISTTCEDALKNAKYNLGLNVNHLEVCYAPIIQSGGNYSLKYSAESSDSALKVGTMIFGVGVRYRNYCSNVIRTYMVNPTPSQTECYSFLYSLYEFAVAEIREGLKFSDLAEKIVAKAGREKPAYKDHLLRTFGFVTGIEFRDPLLVISTKSTAVFSKNMSINLSLGIENVEVTLDKKKKAKESYWIGDILLVGRDRDGSGENRVFTKQCRAALSKISMTIKDEDEEEPEDNDTEEEAAPEAANRKKPKSSAPDLALGRGQRGAILSQKTRNENNTEDQRMTHQMELFEKMLTNVKERLTGVKTNTGAQKEQKSAMSYKSIAMLPKEDDVKDLRLYVDKKYNTLIAPIFGMPFPIHVSLIKTVVNSVIGDYTYLRVNLFYPGININAKDLNLNLDARELYVKEFSLRGSNARQPGQAHISSTNLVTAFRNVKELQSKYRSREAEIREMADMVEQDDLICQSKPSARLKDVFIRPSVFGKRLMGVLEAHQNGFRYTNIRGDKVDILFNNIKRAFYQPCDSELFILIHFHLKNGIMLNKKKHLDIQFYTEVGETTTDLDRAHGYSHRDRDDLESEHREREMRNHLKNAFQSFCQKASAASNGVVDFDSPFRELGFSGAPFRSTVFLQPTTDCLVSLVEWPPFVVFLEEVEFFYFERVSLNIRTFDLAIIMKDYKVKPQLISSIPATSLDDIKAWIDQNDIFYGEGMKSLNWPKLLKTVTDDPQAFLEEGGWGFLKPLDDESENEDDELLEDDEEFVPSEDASQEGSESDASEEDDSDAASSDWDAENESDSGSGELDSDESEGKDWDELEAIARREDAEKDIEVEERPTHKRPKAGGKRGSPPPKRRK